MKTKTKTPPAAETTTYLLRDIDSTLWARFKARAESSDIPMRTALLELVGAFADGHIAVSQRTAITFTTRK